MRQDYSYIRKNHLRQFTTSLTDINIAFHVNRLAMSIYYDVVKFNLTNKYDLALRHRDVRLLSEICKEDDAAITTMSDGITKSLIEERVLRTKRLLKGILNKLKEEFKDDSIKE